jgi:hypothetical protein
MQAGRIPTLILLLLAATFSIATAQSRVYRDRVVPHWDTSGTQFWYRNDLPGESREFVLVNALSGTRELAFNHPVAAAEFSKLLERPIDAQRIPIQELQFPEGDAGIWKMRGPDGEFTWNSVDNTLKRLRPAASAAFQLFLPPRPSGPSTEDTSIVFTNQLTAAVTLVWINPDGGRRDYATVSQGQTHRQHTFVGHTWLFKAADGRELGCATAAGGANEWTLNENSLSNVQRAADPPRTRRGRRSPEAPPENAAAPQGRFNAFVRDHNLWLKSDKSEEFQLTSNASAEHTFRRDAQRGASRRYGLQSLRLP